MALNRDAIALKLSDCEMDDRREESFQSCDHAYN